MPILVKPTKTKLAWSDFTVSSDALQDDEAEAGYGSEFRPAVFKPRNIKGRAHLPATYTIRVWPKHRVAPGADKTAELLAHEQVHYDVGIVCARALARDLKGVNGADPDELLTLIDGLHDLHMLTRAGAIQDAYDTQTKHGHDSTKQKEWETAMAQCLASTTMTRIMGLPL